MELRLYNLGLIVFFPKFGGLNFMPEGLRLGSICFLSWITNKIRSVIYSAKGEYNHMMECAAKPSNWEAGAQPVRQAGEPNCYWKRMRDFAETYFGGSLQFSSYWYHLRITKLADGAELKLAQNASSKLQNSY